MANRIDQSSFLIPGVDLRDIDAVDDVDGVAAADEDSPRPYSGLLTQSLGGAFPSNWQDLFGSNQTMPEPSQMDPPSKPAAPDDSSALGKEAFFGSMRMSGSSLSASDPPNARVQRMVELMNSSFQTVKGLRARGAAGNYQ
jgi:hypothetical protein